MQSIPFELVDQNERFFGVFFVWLFFDLALLAQCCSIQWRNHAAAADDDDMEQKANVLNENN